MEPPLITIGIASFNALNSIEVAVNSALSQSWWPIEIIVVDDCSSDGTYENYHQKIKLLEFSKIRKIMELDMFVIRLLKKPMENFWPFLMMMMKVCKKD